MNEEEKLMNATWRQKAACQGLDPDIFYPVSEDDADEAKEICAQCGVRQVCLEFALTQRERDGVWVASPIASAAASSVSAARLPRSRPPLRERHP